MHLPFRQDIAWSISKHFPQAQLRGNLFTCHRYLRASASKNSLLFGENPSSFSGRAVNQAEAPFTLAKSFPQIFSLVIVAMFPKARYAPFSLSFLILSSASFSNILFWVVLSWVKYKICNFRSNIARERKEIFKCVFCIRLPTLGPSTYPKLENDLSTPLIPNDD